jgi:hypothetical protein
VNVLGIQTQRGGEAFRSMLRNASPYTIKCIDQVDRDGLTEWRARRPDGLLVLRKYFPDEELRAEKVDELLRWADTVRNLNPILEVPINEAHQDGDDLKRFADYSAEAARKIAAAGYKPIVGNFSEGNPPHLEQWPSFAPALQAARELGGYLGLHEYFTPGCYLDTWHSLRYRRVWELLPEALRVPILITECGIDGGINAADGNRPKSGWRAYADGGRYCQLLRGYRDELAKDAYVHGAHVFGCAMYDDWQSFDVGDEVDLRPAFGESVDGPPRWVPPAPGQPTQPQPPTQPEPPQPEPVPPVTVPGRGRLDPATNPWRGKVAIVHEMPDDLDDVLGHWKELGIEAVDLKICDGDSSWLGRRVLQAQADKIRQAGFRLLLWGFHYCDGRVNAGDRGDGVPEREAEAALAMIRALEPDGYTFDLEDQCEGHQEPVERLITAVRDGTSVPLGAYIWAFPDGHAGYAWDAIWASCDVMRPMIYRAAEGTLGGERTWIWNAERSWRLLGPTMYRDRLVCPAWSVMSHDPPERGGPGGLIPAAMLREDMAVADAQGVNGESYWTGTFLLERQDLTDLIRSRSFGAPAPAPAPTAEEQLRDRYVEPLYRLYEQACREADPRVIEAAGGMRSIAMLLKRALGFTD